MAPRATVDETGADRRIGVDVSDAVLCTQAEALKVGEFSLEQLPSASYGSSRIAQCDEGRGTWRHGIADARSNLL